MNDTAPETFTETLERMGLSDVLTGYVDPQRVRRWGFTAVAAFALEHGHEFVRESNNVYGKLMLVPVAPHAVPNFKIISRQDHAAVHPSRPRRAA